MALQTLASTQFTKYIPFADSEEGTVDFGRAGIYTSGGITAAGGQFFVNSCGGDITTCGGILAASDRFSVNSCGGDITTCGGITAASDRFSVNSCGGDITTCGGILAASGQFAVSSDGFISAANFKSTTSGVFIGDMTYYPTPVNIDGHSGYILIT